MLICSLTHLFIGMSSLSLSLRVYQASLARSHWLSVAFSGWTSPAAILGVVFTFTLIALLCWAGRMSIRLFIVRQPGWDDLMVTVSMVFTLIDAIAQPVKIRHGLGKHAASITEYQMHHMLRTFWRRLGATF